MEAETWIKAKGKLLIEPKAKRIAVGLGFDFVNYYAWLLENDLKESFHYPRHGGHITIANENIHKQINYAAAKAWAGKWIDFEYNPEVIIGGKSKGFKNFWMKVRSREIEIIKKEIGVRDTAGFLGLHITLANSKGGFRKFQKQLIIIIKPPKT